MIYVDGTLIIVALYIGNLDEKLLNISINCLRDLRKHFADEYIVIVDNNSYNQDWIEIAKSLNMTIIKNTSDLHRYEPGAYNLALQHYRAKKYLCIQHNFQFTGKIIQELLEDKPDAYVFGTTRDLNWNILGLNLINRYLKALNMSKWNWEPLVISNSFYCNDLMMDKLIENGLFKLITNTKDISQAYERIIGTVIYRTIGYVKKIDSSIFNKINFNQY